MSTDRIPRLPGNEKTGDETWLRFAELCEALAGTSSKLKKRAAMAEYLRSMDASAAGLAAQYLTGAVFAESDERKVQVGGQFVVRALESLTQATPEQFHAAYRRHGDLGAAAEELMQAGNQHSAGLTLAAVQAELEALAGTRLQAAKSTQILALLKQLSPVETKYLIKLLLGDMRMGVKQSLVEEAIAEAAGEELAAVRRAETMLGNIAAVVELAWRHDLEAARFKMFHALGFMLATPAEDAAEAFARFAEEPAQIEDKYDGMRAQIHCGDPEEPGRVRIFSRTREDVTASFPELAEWFAGVSGRAILDGEILAWDYEAACALPFTALQQRLGRKRVTTAMREQTQILYMAFDLLLAGDELLLDRPLGERRRMLESWAQSARNAPRKPLENDSGLFVTAIDTNIAELVRLQVSPAMQLSSEAHLEEAFTLAQQRGNEGLMLKSLASIYQPGRRGAAWLKLKRELATLDVVVTAAEYGNGRRAQVLSDVTFAVRDGERLLNVGKAYSGLTDAEIESLTKWFHEHTLDTRGGQLLVEPKIVLEVAFNNMMLSDRHDSGYSLRFPRILRIRTDKPVEEIDTLGRVAEIYRSQGKE